MGLETIAGGAEMAHSDVKTGVTTAFDYWHDARMQDRAVSRQMQLNRQMAGLAADARRSSAADAAQGFKAAGLHPALASGANFGSVSSGGSVPTPDSSANMSEPSGYMARLALDGIKYRESERSLMDAQSRKTDAEAESLEIDNENKHDKNTATSRVARDYFNSVLKDGNASGEVKSFARMMLSTPLSFGSLEGYNATIGQYGLVDKALKEKLDAQVDQKLSATKLYDSEYAPLVAGADKEQAKLITEQIKNIAKSTAYIEAEIARSGQETEVLKEQIKLIGAQISHLRQDVESTHNKDLVGLFDRGEYLKFAIGLGTSIVNTGLSTAGGIIGSYAGASRAIKGRSPNPAFMKGLAQ